MQSELYSAGSSALLARMASVSRHTSILKSASRTNRLPRRAHRFEQMISGGCPSSSWQPPPRRPAPSPAGRTLSWRGDETYLCVVLSSSLDWAEDTKYVRLGFRAEVDTFARLEVRGAWAPLTSRGLGAHHALNSTSIGLSLQSEGKRSYQRRWRDLHRGSPSTFPVLYAQVVLDRGEVAAVAWDAGCFDCEEEDAACTANEFEYDGSMAKDAAEQCPWPTTSAAKGEAQCLRAL